MSTPTKAAVDDATVSAFTALALGETRVARSGWRACARSCAGRAA